MKTHSSNLLTVALPLFFLAFPSFSDSGFLDFYSPVFLGGGGGTATLEAPQGSVFNPASAGGVQRVTADLSYIALSGLGSESGYGNVINAGLALPTRAGVLGVTGRFAQADFPSLSWGSMGGLTVSFAKDLFPDLYVGAGVGFEYGDDWGLGLDLGFLHLIGDVGGLKDFRWGVAFRNIGKAYTHSETDDVLGWPPPFTPAIGAHFAVVKTDSLTLALNPDLSFPALQDLRLGVGTQLGISDTFFLNAAYVFDLREMNGTEPERSIPLAVGATLKLKLETGIKGGIPEVKGQDSGRDELSVNVGAAPLQEGIWGFGGGVTVAFGQLDKTPPEISIDTQGEKYISPNFDGVKDDLVLPLSIKDARYVKGFRFVVQDSSGAEVRSIANKEDRPENRDLNNMIKRLMYVKTGIVVPESVRWDGKSDSGSVVPDGTYRYFVEAWDDNGNTGRTPLGTVVVDNTPPQISVAAPYLIYSPDGDGNKDTLPIQQSGSKEDKWVGTVFDISGKPVRSYVWEGSQPVGFAWDGKTDQGVLAPDGVYGYRAAATDRAGNSASAELANIIIDTQAAPIQLSIDLSFFSPNGDGVKDAVTFTPNVPVLRGIERWDLSISDSTGASRRLFSGKVEMPASFVWDGKDDAGAALPEGAYNAKLAILYVNGHNPSAESPSITIKLSQPKASVTAEYDVFSPTGDSRKNTVAFHQDTSEELFWTGTLTDPRGKDVKNEVWRGKADEKFVWDGRGDDGALLPDGLYTYVLTATDRAGNTGHSRPVSVRIDTAKKPVRLSTDAVYFSPFGDGTRNRVKLMPSLAVTSGVESFTLNVKDAGGRTVRGFSGKNRVPGEILWDGIDDAGKRVPDGQYSAELTVLYANGSQPKAVCNPFYSDNHYPQIEVTSDVLLFSPDGKSRLQKISVKQSSSEEDLWEGELRGAKGEKIRSWFWKGKAADFTWDGKDENGNAVPDGVYSYIVKARSRAGNLTVKELAGIRVDTRPTPVYVTVSSDGFSPNADGFRDDIGFNILVQMKEGIRSWKLLLVSSASGIQKEFGGQAPVPQSLTWDGKGNGGEKLAAEGGYIAILEVDYYKGNLAEARTAPFLLNVTPPKVEIALEGLPFSPDNDGFNDELSIGLAVKGSSAIESWSIQIMDPADHPFASFSGKGAPAEKIIWGGTSDKGELVESAEDYPLAFTIRDVLGNSATYRSIIPVDILVIRDGDRLKVRIASITFAANTADYVNVEPEKAEKNARTLRRLAEIFKKYSSYRITIEGHANLVNWENPSLAKKEQETELLPLSKARAQAIKAALTAEGIGAGRISTTGLGALEPVVPFGDLDNRWKNRRVEFILVRE